MNIDTTLFFRIVRPVATVLALGAAMASAPALAARNAAMADAHAQYEHERAVCMSGHSNQNRATCLKEAGAAYAEAKRGALSNGAMPGSGNETKRCERLPDDDRQACMARMRGQGTTSGSAAAGGIYRELVTRQVGSVSSPAPEPTSR